MWICDDLDLCESNVMRERIEKIFMTLKFTFFFISWVFFYFQDFFWFSFDVNSLIQFPFISVLLSSFVRCCLSRRERRRKIASMNPIWHFVKHFKWIYWNRIIFGDIFLKVSVLYYFEAKNFNWWLIDSLYT